MGRLSKWLYTCFNRRKVSTYKKIPNSTSSLVELNAETVEIHILSIKCASCAANVEILVKNIAGVYDVTVNVVSKIAYVTLDPTLTSPEKILDIIIENSHTAVIGARNKKEWRIVYFKCKISVWNSKTEELFDVYKLKHIRSDRKTHYFSVEYRKKCHGIRKVFQDLEAAFQKIEIVDVSDVFPSQNKAEVKYWRNMCIISSFFGVITMVLMILEHNNPKLSNILIAPGLSYTNLVSLISSTIVQVVVGRSIYVSAIRSIRTGLNMNFLISTATTVAYVYSCIVLILSVVKKYQHGSHTFFDTPPMLYMIVTLGRYIECKSRMHSVTSIMKLMKPNRQSVTIYPDSKNPNIYQEISSDLITESDILHVYHGMCVPCDGVIYEADTPGMFNEAVITGESLPVQKKLLDEVFCGSINEGNPLKIKVTRTGDDCRVQQITRCVQVALSKKIPLNNIVDIFSRLFTPGILLLSMVTFSVWIFCFHNYPNLAKKLDIDSYLAFTFQTSISVLCVACPCAIGLAIPLAVMISTGVGAKYGILIKGAPPLQSMARVKKIVFDKTGTLTVGIPTVEQFFYDSCSNIEIYKNAVYSIVSFSNHILSRCIKKYFENCNFNSLNIQDYKEIPGLGLSGKVIINLEQPKYDEDQSMAEDDPGTDNKDTLEVVIGNEEMLNLNSITTSEVTKHEVGEYASGGATIVYAAIKDRFFGYFVIRDEIRMMQNRQYDICPLWVSKA
ncbi:Copper-transporting ATPase 2 [Thelohanellus kitauei]|uniref:P-type Cu(+) transporter n=1 Tax=Thelohanellus kitauei TaxID=669202 RepID=A0A0C2IX18_THEKT|nr:Copper-transporting ATPase 2 [Thelohanellus kitauei]